MNYLRDKGMNEKQPDPGRIKKLTKISEKINAFKLLI
jgi:hypothetical protein